ncbi:MAG: COX15/CtaA family protein [Gammaproteobacteria bacterium]|nr:COX15/CtaA family protein [Gammaproteobacteria bacterium]
MVFVMVVLGGVTRLTHSGLSMVEWKPLTGWLPPLDAAEWQRTFEQYQHYPEFQQLNRHMSVTEFKGIFWLEFIHRVWGRTIGLVFLLPLLGFAFAGALDRTLLLRLGALFVLGGMQGVLGWYMVMSGLVDRPDVSAQRLAAHLGLAFLLYGYMLWIALGLLFAGDAPAASARLRGAAVAVFALVCVTVLSGALVAGTDAGYAYNTFPLMAGRLVPDHYLAMQPLGRNFFENIATVQFNHRVLALTSAALVLALCVAGRTVSARRLRYALYAFGAAALVQLSLGIATLLLVVPVALAAAHQAGGLLLVTAGVWVLFESFHGATHG